MKLLVLSDLHLEFAPMAVPAEARFDVAVLAGDIGCPGSAVFDWVRRSPPLQRARAVLLVPGNHEYYGRVMQDERALMQRLAAPSAGPPAAPPIHLLDGAAVVIDGVRFLGCTLWTDFELRIDTPAGPASDTARGIAAARKAMVDYRTIDMRPPPAADAAGVAGTAAPGAGCAGVGSDVAGAAGAAVRKLTAEDTLLLHRAQRAWLQQALAEPFDGPTVVITHHGPHRGSLAPRFAADWVSTAFISELPVSFFDVAVLWVHGHTHAGLDYRVGGCRVLCNPRGYPLGKRGEGLPENPQFDPALIVTV